MLSDKLMLDAQTMARMVETKVTCPFLGGVAAQELLSIRGSANNPLAAIEDVRRLGMKVAATWETCSRFSPPAITR